MSRELTVGSNTYEYPDNNADPGSYGEDASDWAEAINDVVATLFGTYDVANTTASLTNNQSTAADVSGLLFDSSVVRSFIVNYVVYRSTDSGYANESGTISAVYDGDTAWVYTIDHEGDGEVDFQVTSVGQVQYFTSDLSGTNYSGTTKFNASAITV